MADFVELQKCLRRLCKDTIEAHKPCNVLFGTVTQESPLEITIDAKHVLTEDFIVLTRNVTDHEIEMTVDHWTEDETQHVHGPGSYSNAGGQVGGVSSPTSHRHAYKGRKVFLVHKKLLEGEKVVLIREQGGQRYVVMDRVGED